MWVNFDLLVRSYAQLHKSLIGEFLCAYTPFNSLDIYLELNIDYGNKFKRKMNRIVIKRDA